MEVNKENENNKKILTKIPVVPQQHLPQLPKHLLYEDDCHHICNGRKLQRPPLKILNSFPQPSCSQPSPLLNKLDSRHVTFRHIHESPLDWDLKVFKDIPNRNDERDGPEGKSMVVTPTPSKLLECNLVKNVKKSLKRPHSREIQGLSPLEEGDTRKHEVKRKLLYSDLLTKSNTPRSLDKQYKQGLVRDYTTDILMHLLNVERKTCGTARVSNVTRACIVNWLIKINPIRNPHVVQTACWYLDSLLAIEDVRLEDLQLLGTACYWVALKHCVVACSARRLVKLAAEAFSVADLKAAERKVLSKLSFPPQPVIVHDFATYLCWWCDPKCEELEVAATYLTLVALLGDKWLASELPSVLAAAVVTTAITLMQKRQLLDRLNKCPLFDKPEVKTGLEFTCTRVRRVLRLIALPRCEYRAPYVLYSQPPHFVALKLARAVRTRASNAAGQQAEPIQCFGKK